MKEGLVVLSAIAGIIIVFTLLSGGTIGLGTSPQGPHFSFGYAGPSYRGASLG